MNTATPPTDLIKPQFAYLVDEAQIAEKWPHEIKYRGYSFGLVLSDQF